MSVVLANIVHCFTIAPSDDWPKDKLVCPPSISEGFMKYPQSIPLKFVARKDVHSMTGLDGVDE